MYYISLQNKRTVDSIACLVESFFLLGQTFLKKKKEEIRKKKSEFLGASFITK